MPPFSHLGVPAAARIAGKVSGLPWIASEWPSELPSSCNVWSPSLASCSGGLHHGTDQCPRVPVVCKQRARISPTQSLTFLFGPLGLGLEIARAAARVRRDGKHARGQAGRQAFALATPACHSGMGRGTGPAQSHGGPQSPQDGGGPACCVRVPPIRATAPSLRCTKKSVA